MADKHSEHKEPDRFKEFMCSKLKIEAEQYKATIYLWNWIELATALLGILPVALFIILPPSGEKSTWVSLLPSISGTLVAYIVVANIEFKNRRRKKALRVAREDMGIYCPKHSTRPAAEQTLKP